MRMYKVRSVDALALARLYGITHSEIAAHIGISLDYVRVLARSPRHAGRVRVSVFERVLSKERLQGALR